MAEVHRVDLSETYLELCSHGIDPQRFAWKQPPYEYEYERLPIDLLAGSSALRQQIEAGTSAADIARSWEPAVREFRTIREQFLLY